MSRYFKSAFVFLLVMRFAVPMMALGNEALYRVFMADEYRHELAAIEKSSSVVLGPKDADSASEDGIWARFQRWKARSADLKAGYDATLQAASGWSRTIVKLIALFVVQAMLLPVAFLWLVWRFANLAVRRTVPVVRDAGNA